MHVPNVRDMFFKALILTDFIHRRLKNELEKGENKDELVQS